MINHKLMNKFTDCKYYSRLNAFQIEKPKSRKKKLERKFKNRLRHIHPNGHNEKTPKPNELMNTHTHTHTKSIIENLENVKCRWSFETLDCGNFFFFFATLLYYMSYAVEFEWNNNMYNSLIFFICEKWNTQNSVSMWKWSWMTCANLEYSITWFITYAKKKIKK